MRHVATGDGDAHDRSIFHVFDHDGRALLVTGLGVHPGLGVGAGYPPARDWRHGAWKGRGWLDRRAYDLTDPAVTAPAAYGVTDHAARFAWDGRVGYGIFEHGGFGRHTPSGFTGQEAM